MIKAMDRGMGGILNRGILNRGISSRGTLNRGISSRGMVNKAIHNKGAINKASRYAIARDTSSSLLPRAQHWQHTSNAV